MAGRVAKLASVAVAALVGTAAGAVATRVVVVGAATTTAQPIVVPVSPERLVDTRPDDPIGVPAGKLSAGKTLTVTARGVDPVPADAVGVVLNVTAVNATIDTFLTVWPTGEARPLASTLNPSPGGTSFNAATVLLGTKGQFSVYNHAGSVDVIVDVVGYLRDHNHDDRYFTKAETNALYNRSVLDLQGTSALNVVGATATGGGCLTFAAEGGAATLPMPLPIGARISTLKAKTKDTSLAQAVFVNVRRSVFTPTASTENVVGTITSTGAGGLSVFDASILEPVANGVSYDLVISAPPNSGTLSFCGAIVDYTVDPTLVPAKGT